MTTFRQNRLFSSDTTSLQLQARPDCRSDYGSCLRLGSRHTVDIVGSAFFGGVHDYGSLVASLRHKGKSIGQIIEANIGEKAKILFAIFAWITLLVVIAAFANIVAATFVANPGAGTSSLLFILLAVAFGLLVYRTGMSLFLGTVLGLIGMAAAFYIGHIFPIVLSKDMWLLIMMGYIFVASIAPVWILLQPRDYLNSFLLYLMIIACLPRHLLLSANHGDFSVRRL